MWLVVLVAGICWAAPPVPIELPSTEQTEDWTEALALADLSVGAADSGPYVRIEVSGDRWLVHVRDEAGTEQQVEVDVPRSSAEREALAHLVASLARPAPALTVPPLPPLPEPVPEPVVAAPEPEPEPEPEPVAPPPPPEPFPDEPIAIEEPPEPAAPWAFGPWARLAAGLSWRDRGAAPTGEITAGVGAGPARIGLGFTGAGPHAIPNASEYRWTEIDGRVGVWFAIRGGPVLGATGGVGRRSFSGSEVLVRTVASAEIGWRAQLAEGLDVIPLVQVDLDPGIGGLRRTEVIVDGQSVGDLSPIGARLTLGLAPHR